MRRNWPQWKLGHAFQVVGSGTTPASDNAAYYDGTIPWVTTSELREMTIKQTASCVSPDALRDYSVLRLYPKGSLLVAMYGATVGRLGMLGVDAVVNQACCVFAKLTVAVTRFVFYALLAKRDELIGLASEGGQPNLSQSTLRHVKIPLPPGNEEQQAIADFLDRETARIRADRKEERLINLLEESRRSTIDFAVTGELAGIRQYSRSNRWYPRLPSDWTISRIKYTCSRIVDGVHSTPEDIDEGVPFVTVKKFTEGEGISFEDLKYISLQDHLEFSKTRRS